MINSLYTLTGYVKNPQTGDSVTIRYMETEYKYTTDVEAVPGLKVQKSRKAIETKYQFETNVKDWQMLNDKGELMGRIVDIQEKPFNLLQRFNPQKIYVLSLE